MQISQQTRDCLVLKAGGATLTFDKNAKIAELQRKGFLWKPKPVSEPLGEVAQVAIDSATDRASGVEICKTMVVFKSGSAWALDADDAKDAQEGAQTIRKFLGLH